jgi:mRNA deadenylase 3'-5' endonuclease subunit Ccr4
MSGQLKRNPNFMYQEYDDDTCAKYQHPFEFESVYPKEYPERMSTIVEGKGSIVDHIFIGNLRNCPKAKSLHKVDYLSLPVLDTQVVLPNEENPSDHVPLLAQFAFE